MTALLASPLGFLIGVSLGALGGGGSVLAVPVLVFVVGQEPSAATTTSLVVVGVASLFGAVGHWRTGTVVVGRGLLFGLIGVVGSLAGSAANRRIDGDVLLLGFAVLTLVAARRMLVAGPRCEEGGEGTAAVPGAGAPDDAVSTLTRRGTGRRIAATTIAGTAVGFLTGLFGVGGGFVIVPALVLVLGFRMREAVGTSLLVITVNTAVALAARAGGPPVDWSTTLLFAAAATAGVVTGTRVAERIDPAAMQRSFAVLLVAVALYTGVRAGLALV